MFEDLEKKLNRILEIVKICPKELQEKCFEILLSAAVSQHRAEGGKMLEKESEEIQRTDQELDSKGGAELAFSELHTKVKHFLEKEKISVDQINNLFYKENGEIKPLFDHLGSTKLSESQIRISLLEAFRNALTSGEFKVSTEAIKDLCNIYKCYDSPNFAQNFKRNRQFFNEDYKNGGILTLSTEGKERLGEIIKELAI